MSDIKALSKLAIRLKAIRQAIANNEKTKAIFIIDEILLYLRMKYDVKD